MTIAGALAANQARILILDIERVKGAASVEFWDLGDFKNRRIHADDVTAWPRTICAAWKWYGSKPIHFAAEWDADGHDGLMQQTWDAYDQADIVVGHNLRDFDTKKLRSGWAEAGLPQPSPFKIVDTLKVARSVMGMESNTLDALCGRFGLTAKTDRYSHELAQDACAGNRTAQRRIKAYNKGDILASEALYEHLRGWMYSHPHVTTDTEKARCNRCGSDNLDRLTRDYRASVMDYAAYRCRNCKGVVRAGHVRRVARTIGVQ